MDNSKLNFHAQLHVARVIKNLVGKLILTETSKGIVAVQNKTNSNTLSTVLTVTAISSCLMLAAVGTYRLTASPQKDEGQARAENTVSENTEETAE